MRVLLALKARPGQSHNAPALRGQSIEAGFDDMAAKQFNLMTEWRLDAPVERVWPLLTSIEEWPLWWRAVSKVELLKAGDANGLGSIHRITWKTALPYQLTFDTRMTRIEPMSIIEGQASGELDGRGLWTLRPEGERTHVRYDWNVEVTKRWMRVLEPILRPVFAWNHTVVMGWGEEGIRSRLAAG
jgi:uncharacterized protein YndB with AHSA1/START domain